MKMVHSNTKFETLPNYTIDSETPSFIAHLEFPAATALT